tara:strand:- start:10785 stop:11009 length:225 start_codon:yes stop_codon:yes gene_type:complete
MSDWRKVVTRWRHLPIVEKMRIRRDAVTRMPTDAFFPAQDSRDAAKVYIARLREMHPDKILSDRLDQIESDLDK